MSLFVVLEGPEGSGKTTQLRLLHDALTARDYEVVSTREPGGTPIGEQIRSVLHDLQNKGMLPLTEALLYSAARAQHVGEKIAPALRAGRIVLCDRFAASTLAYQGYGHGLDLGTLRNITRLAVGQVEPDLIVYLDLDVAEGLRRKRHDRERGTGEWNRMDDQEVAFHRRVRAGYLEMACAEGERWLVVDASQPVEAVHRLVMGRVLDLLSVTAAREE